MKNLLKIVKLSLLMAGSLSVVSSALIAQDLPLRGSIPFSSFDTNGDGSVSEQEFNDTRAAKMTEKASQGMPMRNAANAPDFSMLDTDNDGKLSKVELLEGQNKQMQINRANRGPGQKSQMRDMPTFESFDLNSDGYLTENEMDEARAKRMQEKASEGKMLRNSGNKSKFSDIDTNNDTKVSKQEFTEHQMRKNR